MKTDDISSHVLCLLLCCCWLPESADGLKLNDAQKIGLYTGCAVGGGVLVIILIVLLVICCRYSKKAKALKAQRTWDYEPFTDPSSLYHDSKSAKVRIPNGNGHVHNKDLSNGKSVTGNAVSKIMRSRSDAYDQRGRVPEWRRQQDKRDGSNVNVRNSIRSDVSVSGGIWTSNPTLTRGLYPSHVTVMPTGNARINQHAPFGSAPALHALQGSVDNSIWERSKSSKLNQSHRRELGKVKEDTKELLPGSSSDDTNSEREQRTIARAYSNAAYQKDKPSASPTKSPGQDNPFVAKIYSDYQQPKDFIPRTKCDRESGKVAKVFSIHGSDNASNRNSTPDSFVSSRGGVNGQTGGTSAHVARVTVSQSSSLDSSGEPKYAKPQDALNKMTHNDWILYSKRDSRLVERSQSSSEKMKAYALPLRSKSNKAQRSSSHVVGRYGAAVNDNVSPQAHARSSTEIDSSLPTVHGRLALEATKQRLASVHSGKLSKDRDNKNKKRNSFVKEKLKTKQKNKFGSKDKNNQNLMLDIKAADENTLNETTAIPAAPLRAVPPLPVHTPITVPSQSPNLEVQSNNSSCTVRPISESSSTDDDPFLVDIPTPTSTVGEITIEDSNAIYASPVRSRSRPNSTWVDVTPDSPMSPRPPPVPPVTKLRDEPIVPPSPPPSADGRRHKSTDGDAVSTDLDLCLDMETDTNTACSLDGITAVLAGRHVCKAFEFLDSYTITSHDDLEDRISVVTNASREGKNVIGDAFRFLEDFEDGLSIDADDRL